MFYSMFFCELAICSLGKRRFFTKILIILPFTSKGKNTILYISK